MAAGLRRRLLLLLGRLCLQGLVDHDVLVVGVHASAARLGS